MRSNGNIEFVITDHIGFVDMPEMAPEQADGRLFSDLADLFGKLGAMEDIRVVVFNAEGRPLCPDPADEMQNELAVEGRSNLEMPSAVERLAAVPQPVVAGIGGGSDGSGLEMILACDIRIAAEGSSFRFSQVAKGMIPCHGGTQRLSRVVGRAKALEMILTGEAIDAREAYRIGLIHKVVPKENLKQSVTSLAQTIADKGPLALRYAKEAVYGGMDLTLAQGLRLEADLYMLLHTSHDRTEGIRAFQEKRRADFTGK